MNRVRLLAITTMLMLALTAPAQQTAAGSGGTDKDVRGHRNAEDGVPTAEQQLKSLTGNLDLSGDQQARVKPILQELHDATMKAVQDKSISPEERLKTVRIARYKADKDIREILNDDQKKKLDQVERGPHPELHGNVNGTTAAQPGTKN